MRIGKKKGQGAMEYLMTYGWAILVVMIVGIVMWQLGIFNIGTTTLTYTGFGAIKPQLAGTGLAADGTFAGVFFNGVGTTAKITGISGDVTSGATTPGPCSGTPLVNGLDLFAYISQGDNFVVTNITCPGGGTGDPYTLDMSISYTVTIGDVTTNRSSSGSIHGPYE